MDQYNGNGDYLFNRIDEMLKKCCMAFSKVLGTGKKYTNHDTVRCQLFGLDILSDETLRPILIEINKGPEMSWSSNVEKEYKEKLASDMFNLLGYLDIDSPNEYIPILTVQVVR